MPGPPQTGLGGEGMGWGGVGGNPLWVYFHIGYRILDIYIYISIYIFMYGNVGDKSVHLVAHSPRSSNQYGPRNHRINRDLPKCISIYIYIYTHIYIYNL